MGLQENPAETNEPGVLNRPGIDEFEEGFLFILRDHEKKFGELFAA